MFIIEFNIMFQHQIVNVQKYLLQLMFIIEQFLFYFLIRFKCKATFLKSSTFFKVVWLALLIGLQCFESYFNSLYVRSNILFQWAISYHAHIRVEKRLYQWNCVQWFDQFITSHEDAEIIVRFYFRSVLTKHLSTINVLFQSFH